MPNSFHREAVRLATVPATRPRQPLTLTLGGLFLALVCPEAVVLLASELHRAHLGLATQEGIFWALTILILLYVSLVEKRPFSSIGLRKLGWRTLVWGVVSAIVIAFGIGVVYGISARVFHQSLNAHAMAQMMGHPWGVRLMLVLRAAIFEEVLYRGYAIERLSELTGSRFAAGAISWIVFTLAHLSYWGVASLVVAGFGGLALTVLYLWRRDLPCNMLAHFLTDGAGFLLH